MRIRRLGMLIAVTTLLVAVLNDVPSTLTETTVVFPTGIDAAELTSARARPGTQAAQINSAFPLVVDGSVHPELVPDRIAYYHFIQSNAQRSRPAQSDLLRSATRLSRLGLSDADRRALERVLRGVADELASAEALAEGPSGNSLTAKLRRDDILASVRAEIPGALSWEGVARLDSFVQNHVKPNVRIFGAVVE